MLRTVTAQLQILIVAQAVRFSNVSWDIQSARHQLLKLLFRHGFLLGCPPSSPLIASTSAPTPDIHRKPVNDF
ncbi:hypothetical protein LZ31DRAFT_172717 [Colletotrichum somersetense]|nr:hypothetical protein LZ31DRAFT_172717 [Colletotrichum somersetense]